MGKELELYIDNLECPEKYKDTITVEHRSNNPKRDFLFCNRIQGKHIPVNPKLAFELFQDLTDMINNKIGNKKILVIGFAETATAIGAYIADHLKSCVYYVQTTREDCSPYKKLIEFREEHSHATEQYLFGDFNKIPDYEYILFVDDEISTGKTIMNFVNELRNLDKNTKFGVASICNWQDSDNIRIFKENDIDSFCIIKGNIKNINAKMDTEIDMDAGNQFAFDKFGDNINKYIIFNFNFDKQSIFYTERVGRLPNSYLGNDTLNKICSIIEDRTSKEDKILILGTEEFMYLPMQIANKMVESGFNVLTHSTSRSSIDVMKNTEFNNKGIKRKFKLHSAYNDNRETYVYNLDTYDKVFIITDGKCIKKFVHDIVSALKSVGNKEENIYIMSME